MIVAVVKVSMFVSIGVLSWVRRVMVSVMSLVSSGSTWNVNRLVSECCWWPMCLAFVER